MIKDDQTLEVLAPSNDMASALAELERVLHTFDTRRGTVDRIEWTPSLIAALGPRIAQVNLDINGIDSALLTQTFSDGRLADEVSSHLSTDLGLMSPEDLSLAFSECIEGVGPARRFERVQRAVSVHELLKNEIGLGWSGFNAQQDNPDEVARIERERMAADFLRGKADWTALRGWELSCAGALIAQAQFTGMLAASETERYYIRVAGEAIIRFNSWEAFAQSVLLGHFFMMLTAGEQASAAASALHENAKVLKKLQTSVWLDTPWVQLEPQQES